MSTQTAVKIRVTSRENLLPDRFNHRRWLVDIVWTTPDEIRYKKPQIGLEITDPFTIGEYQEYEQRLQPVSLSTRLQPSQDAGLTDACSTHAGISDDEQSMSRCNQPSSRLDEYRHQLQLLLQLDELVQSVSLIEIYIIEDLKIESQDNESCYSVHSLLWELLEQNQNIDIQVTRWITGADSPGRLPAGLGASDRRIRILLVIARDFRLVNDRHTDPESVAYDTLYAIVKFLGRNSRLSVDIVRPGTFSELEGHLERQGPYDLVHIDVHGNVKRSSDPTLDYSPQLRFGHYSSTSDSSRNSTGGDSENDPASLDDRSTDEVAKLLTKHDITVVVLSACLSSFGQGRLLSNMCRVFARRGIFAVTGMNFSVKAATAQTYYHGFYEALIIRNQGFRNASKHGRLAVYDELLERKQRKEARKQGQAGSKASDRAPTTPSLPDGTGEGRRKTHNKHQEWPTATTYFAIKALGKTNTFDIMGERSRRVATATSNSRRQVWRFYFFAFALVEGIATLEWWWGVFEKRAWIILAILICLATLVRSHRATSQDFKTFQSGRKKNHLKHSVGLMVLEDILKSAKRLFVQVDGVTPKSEQYQRQCTKDLQDQWQLTRFADSVEIVSASNFKCLLTFWCIWAWYCVSHWCVSLIMRRKDRGSDPKRTSVLIITEIDSIINGNELMYDRALDYMGSFIRAVEDRSPGGSYLMITSHGGVKWRGIGVRRKRYSWIEAGSFSAKLGFHRVKKAP